ncbi:MAG TPA: methionine--tRNA ligase subunit beta, partial [Chitinophagales bacterium]|nr:methionine--tRNA ligase subunit beta [Chitinophagales bacterium]
VIMRVSIDICAILTEVIAPLLPFTSAKLKHQFNDFTEKINPAQILFEKITDEQVAYQIEKLNKTKVTKQENNLEMMPSKAEITYDDFSKLDIRTGIILEAEKVPKADKLLKLLVDVGFEKRTIVSGIAEHFAPEEIIGREVSVLINLAPRKLRGIESNGMILMAEDGNGKLYFVNASHVAAGNSIK